MINRDNFFYFYKEVNKALERIEITYYSTRF